MRFVTLFGILSNVQVAIFDVDQEKGTQLQERLQKQYGTGEVTFITCDVTSESQMTGEQHFRFKF